MKRLSVAPIVEGHGEVGAVRILLERLWRELLDGEFVEVLQPIRRPRTLLVKHDELSRAVRLAAAKLAEVRTLETHRMVLLLLDADQDRPCVLAPQLQQSLRETQAHVDIACVLANVEYETWFVAAAESLPKYLIIRPGERIPESPEQSRCGKRWVAERCREIRYSETRHQPRMTATMDLALARRRSPSFDKLCRELESRLRR